MSCQNCAEEVAAAQKKRTAQLREHQAKLVAADEANRASSFPSQEEAVRVAQKDVKPDKAIEEPKVSPRAERHGVVVEAEPEPAHVVEPEPEVVEEEVAVDPTEPTLEPEPEPEVPAEVEGTGTEDTPEDDGQTPADPEPEPEKPVAKTPRTKAKSADSL